MLEALIFASPQPLTPREIGKVLGGVPQGGLAEAAVDELQADYARDGRGLQLVEVAGGYQITTRPEYNDWIRELLDPQTPTRLSIQALETLAVIAYKQPVTLPEIIELRGVKSGGVLKTLLEKRLIRSSAARRSSGRPMLYGTTKEFLLHFGLKDLARAAEDRGVRRGAGRGGGRRRPQEGHRGAPARRGPAGRGGRGATGAASPRARRARRRAKVILDICPVTHVFIGKFDGRDR